MNSDLDQTESRTVCKYSSCRRRGPRPSHFNEKLATDESRGEEDNRSRSDAKYSRASPGNQTQWNRVNYEPSITVGVSSYRDGPCFRTMCDLCTSIRWNGRFRHPQTCCLTTVTFLRSATKIIVLDNNKIPRRLSY